MATKRGYSAKKVGRKSIPLRDAAAFGKRGMRNQNIASATTGAYSTKAGRKLSVVRYGPALHTDKAGRHTVVTGAAKYSTKTATYEQVGYRPARKASR